MGAIPTPDDVQAAQLADLRRCIRLARKYNNKRRWRRAIMLRTTSISLCLRAFKRVLAGEYTGRIKHEDGRWAILAHDGRGAAVIVAYVGGGSTRGLDDVRAPISIAITRPELVDIEALRAATGSQTIEGGEADS
jgi:hypothetical protein